MINNKIIHHILLVILKTFNTYRVIAFYFLKLSRKNSRSKVLVPIYMIYRIQNIYQ